MEIVNAQPDPVNPADAPDPGVGVSEIESLIGQAQDASQSSRPLMQPKASEKKKNGRPRKDPSDPKWAKVDGADPQAEAAAQPLPPPFDVTPACVETFRAISKILVARTTLPEMALEEQEIQSLGQAWGAVANHYAPEILRQHGPLIHATVVTGAITLRLNQTLQAEIDRRRAASAKEVPNEPVQAQEKKSA